MIYQLETYEIIVVVSSLLVSLSFHEWAHAGMAYLFGDHTAKEQGRLSLNPLVHIDFLGLLAILFVGFGWAKPVQISLKNCKNPVRAEICIALAGPFSNLFLASVLLALLLRNYFPASLELAGISLPLSSVVYLTIHLNLVLFVFNLLPIPPLDGSHLISALIPKHMAQTRKTFEYYGQFALLGMIILGAVFQYSLLPIAALTEKVVQLLVPLLAPQTL